MSGLRKYVQVCRAMSDREGHSGGPPPVDDDLSLPKATVTKMITGDLISLRLLFHFTITHSRFTPQRRSLRQGDSRSGDRVLCGWAPFNTRRI
jgi:hypothetical protein